MPDSSDIEATMRGRLAAYESWAQTEDRSARTAPGRAALMARFERQVDPHGRLAPAERVRRAEYARKAHYTRLALKSAQVRKANAAARAAARPKPDHDQRIAELDALAAGGEASAVAR